MLEKVVLDQADGLRRLMAASSAGRVVVVVDTAAVARACSVTLNLMAALTQQGQEVLLLDERSGPQSLPPSGGGRLVLVDAVLDSHGALSSLAAGADHIVVVFQASAEAIKQAYLCIKKLHCAHPFAPLRVLVHAADDPAQARRLLDNLASTGSRYLGVVLQPAGFVRAEPFQDQDFRQIASDLLQWAYAPVAGRTSLPEPGLATHIQAHAVAGMH